MSSGEAAFPASENPGSRGRGIVLHKHLAILGQLDPFRPQPETGRVRSRSRSPPAGRSCAGGTESLQDSPLEGDGFELLVRGRGQSGCRPFWVGSVSTNAVHAAYRTDTVRGPGLPLTR